MPSFNFRKTLFLIIIWKKTAHLGPLMWSSAGLTPGRKKVLWSVWSIQMRRLLTSELFYFNLFPPHLGLLNHTLLFKTKPAALPNVTFFPFTPGRPWAPLCGKKEKLHLKGIIFFLAVLHPERRFDGNLFAKICSFVKHAPQLTTFCTKMYFTAQYVKLKMLHKLNRYFSVLVEPIL